MILISIHIDHFLPGQVYPGTFTNQYSRIPGNISEISFNQADQFIERNIPDRTDHHSSRPVIPFDEIDNIVPPEAFYRLLASQDISTDRIIRINQFLEIVENQFARTIFVRIDLIDHHLFFFLYLFFGKYRMKHDIGEQFQSPFIIPGQEGSINTSIFFRRISIQFSSHIFYAAQDMKGFSFLRPFKNHMLDKMSDPLFFRALVPATDTDNQSTPGSFTVHLLMNDLQSIFQYMSLIHAHAQTSFISRSPPGV